MHRISPRLGRRLSAARPAVHSLLCAALLACGCSALHETQKTQYVTVQADGQHDTVLAEAEHAKAVDYLCGRTCGGACDLAKAEEHLQQALVADVTYGPAHNTLGMLYLKQHKLYLAAWEFEYANKQMPERFEPLYNLALVYEAADKLDRAIEYASMAFSIAPRNADVMETLIRTRLRNGESLEEVRPLVKEVLFYETRPSWVCWAKEQLSRAPENPARLPVGPPAPGEVPPPEPLFKDGALPPAPRDTPSPKVAQPNLPNQATSSTGPVLDGPVLEAAQSEHGAATTSTTPSNQPLLISGRPPSSVAQPGAQAAALPSPITRTSTSASSTTDSPSPGNSGSQDPKSAPALPEAP
jgi:Tfp pilus assembly protein PilF